MLILTRPPAMASYALYLVPSEDTVYPHEIVPALRELQDAGDWGGVLHMTLCSFAGKKDTPAARRRCEHSCSLTAAAAAAATAGSAMYPGQPFFITRDKWSGPHAHGSLQIFDVDKPSRTLAAVLATLRDAGVRNVKSNLHVSLRSEAVKIAGPMIDFLSQVQWDVCIAKIADDNDQGINLELRERYRLGPR